MHSYTLLSGQGLSHHSSSESLMLLCRKTCLTVLNILSALKNQSDQEFQGSVWGHTRSTNSDSITGVKQYQVGLVLGWVTSDNVRQAHWFN